MKKILFSILLIPSIASAYSTIFNPFTGKLDYVGIDTTTIAGNFIQNRSTLQSGAVFYTSSGSVSDSFNLYGDLKIKIDQTGVDYLSYSTTTAKLRLVNGATTLATSLPLLLWNNNSIVGRFTGIGFAIGASSSPLAYWYLDNSVNRLTMADGSGNIACYFDTFALNLVCNYGIVSSTATFGSPTITTFSSPWVVVNSSGNAQAISVTESGNAGIIQDDNSGAVNIKQLNTGDGLVIVSSYTSNQVGTSDILILDRSTTRNDPLIRIIRNSNNSAPDFRVDAPAPNMEQVATSTDNAHGRGKWEPYATPFQSEILQVNSRSWDNTTFENLAYWEPLSIQPSIAKPGLFLRAQDLTNDSGIISSSNTAGVNFFTQNNHTVGLTGPLNVASGSWRLRLPSTIPATGQMIYMSGADSLGDYPMNLATDFTYSATTGVSASTSTVSAKFTLPSYTKAQLGSRAPSAAGAEEIYCSDCTNSLTCVSTGTASGAYASEQAANRTTACN